MQGNSLNFIPFEYSKKSIIQNKSTMDLLFDSESSETKKEGSLWKERRRDSYRIQLLFAEMARNIMIGEFISDDIKSPDYYPKVPTYTPPQGRIYSSKEIALYKRKKLQEDDFIQSNVQFSEIPLSETEVDERYGSMLVIDPLILCNSVIHQQDVDIITGFMKTKNFSYPVINTVVGYLVGTIVDIENGSTELSSIYALTHPKALRKLLELLDEISVRNDHELKKVKEYIATFLS